MKITLLTTLTILAVTFALPSYADEDDSIARKATKVKVLRDADDNSALEKATKLKVADEVIEDEEDSAAKKAIKLKVIKEVGE